MKVSFVLTVLCITFLSFTAQAQKDLTKKVNGLPAKDATYMIHSEKNVFFYAVKQTGKVVDYQAFDARGAEIQVSQNQTKPAQDGLKAGQPSLDKLAPPCTTTVCTLQPTGKVCVQVPCPNRQ